MPLTALPGSDRYALSSEVPAELARAWHEDAVRDAIAPAEQLHRYLNAADLCWDVVHTSRRLILDARHINGTMLEISGVVLDVSGFGVHSVSVRASLQPWAARHLQALNARAVTPVAAAAEAAALTWSMSTGRVIVEAVRNGHDVVAVRNSRRRAGAPESAAEARIDVGALLGAEPAPRPRPTPAPSVRWKAPGGPADRRRQRLV